MKTKLFLLLCILLGLGMNQLYAQLPPEIQSPDNKTGNGAVSYSFTWDAYWQPISCDGSEYNLVGVVNCHMVAFFKNRLPVRANEHIFGTVNCIETTEEFELNEKDKIEFIGLDYSLVRWHFNLVGNLGSHYIGAVTWNCLTGEMWFDKLKCVGK